MKKIQNTILTLIFLLSVNNMSYAQNIIGSSSSSEESVLTPKRNNTVNLNKNIKKIDNILKETKSVKSKTISKETSLAAGVQSIPMTFGCTVPPLFVSCVGVGSSAPISTAMIANFEKEMLKMEKDLVSEIGIVPVVVGENIATLCNETTLAANGSVLRYINCQEAIIQNAFIELSKKRANMLTKFDENLYDIERNVSKTEVKLNSDDKLGRSCEAAARLLGANDIIDRTENKYKEMQNTLTEYSNLNKTVLQNLSGVDEDYDYTEDSLGAANARYTSSTTVFEMAGDLNYFNKSEADLVNEKLVPVGFDNEGKPEKIDLSDLYVPANFRYDSYMPGADRNYMGTVLDRPVIKTDLHSFAATVGGITLTNPLPESINYSYGADVTELVKEKAKQARYSLSQDIMSFSTSFREVTLPSEGSAVISPSADYVRKTLEKYHADPGEYEDIGTDISEYQFLDSLARRIPQAPGYYATVFNDNIENIDKEIVKNLATTLSIKWKQYQVLEKMLAVRSANLAVSIEDSK